MVLSAAFWAFGDALELSVTGPDAKRLMSQIQYLGVVSVAPFFLHAVLALSRMEKRLSRAVLLAVWGVPLITLGVAWTSQWHHWLWKSITVPDPVSNAGVYQYGWWFWIFAAQSYVLLAVGSVIMLRTVGKIMPPFRGPMRLVVVAVLLPWIGNLAYNFKIGPWPGVNWFSISITLSGILMAWSTLHGGLLDVLPSAREALVECMGDGVMVLDKKGRVLLHNTSAEPYLGKDRAAELIRVVAERMSHPEARTWQGEIQLDSNGTTRWLDVRATPVLDRWMDVAGRLLVLRDVTAQKKLQNDKEKLIAELRTALDEVKTLKGLLPICASCKKIRDDHGYWNHVESYFAAHTDVRFTHGLCPECSKQFMK